MGRLMVKLNNGVKKKGFTLIEIIIVLAIMSVISYAIFSFIMFNYNVYNKGTKDAERRNDVSIASQFITKQLRYAKTVNLYNSVPSSFSVSYNYIYISGNKIYIRKQGIGTQTPINSINNYTLNFNKGSLLANNNNVINFTVGKVGETRFNIITSITCMNKDKSLVVYVKNSAGSNLDNYYNYTGNVFCIQYTLP